MTNDGFWEDPEIVARFAARDVDHRVRAFLQAHDHPRALRALDVGCAGGRNTVALAELGVDVHAVDLSAAMVQETRARLEPIVGRAAAEARVRVGPMDDLGAFADASFDLVIALGVYHEAGSMDEWHRALAESARVLAPGGHLLVAHFAPGTVMEEAPPVATEEEGVFVTVRGRRRVLLDAETIDGHARHHGLTPASPTQTVAVELDEGRRRVTVNADYTQLA